MERQRRGFGAAVSDHVWGAHGRRERGHGDNGAVIGRDHGGEHRARELEVRERIDGKDALDGALRGGEEWPCRSNAGVVD